MCYMKDVLAKIQDSNNNNNKTLCQLIKYYEEVNNEEFFDDLLDALLCCFLSDYKINNPFANRALDFFADFIIKVSTRKEDFDESLLRNIIKKFLEYHTVDSDCIRFRICQFINKLLMHLVPALSDEICDDIIKILLVRIKDIKFAVRVQAFETLCFFQNPHKNEDPIIKVLSEHMIDNSPKIRLIIVENIYPNSDVLPVLLTRCMDINEKVRLIAYHRFANMHMKVLKIVQRQSLLRRGMKDASQNIRSYVETKLLPKWLACYDNNILEFIDGLLLDADEKEIKNSVEVADIVVKSLFSSQSVREVLEVLILENRFVEYEKLTWSTAIYWRTLISYLKSSPDLEIYLEQVLPETIHFCDYTEQYYFTMVAKSMQPWEYIHFQMILLELVNISLMCDISDECSRLKMKDMIFTLLREATLPLDVVRLFSEYLEDFLIPDVEERIEVTCELISNIRNPLSPTYTGEKEIEFKQKCKEIKQKIHSLECEQSIVIKEEDFLLAAQFRDEIKKQNEILTDLIRENEIEDEEVLDKKMDPATVKRCLNIAITLLQSPQVKKLNNCLRQLKDEILKDLFMSDNHEIRSKALQGFALCCYVDRPLAVNHIQLFCAPLLGYRENNTNFNENTVVVAIDCIIDLILIFGSNLLPCDSLNDSESQNSSEHLENMFKHEATFSDIMQILASMMDDQNIEIREEAIEGLVKLLTFNRLESSMLISRLILKWFNPLTARDPKSRQILGEFLAHFPAQEGADLQLEQAFLPTLRTICLAPQSSPLRDVVADDVAKFLVKITSPKLLNTNEAHKNIAVSLCNEMMKCVTDNRCNTVYIKTLHLLELPLNDDACTSELLDLCEMLEDDIWKLTLPYKRYLERFIDSLKNKYNENSINEEDHNRSV